MRLVSQRLPAAPPPSESAWLRGAATTTRVLAELKHLYFSRADREPMAAASFLQETAARMLGYHRIDLVVRGSRPVGRVVLVANHLGYLDPMVLAALHPVLPIAKGELASWPVFGTTLEQLGVIFVDRARPGSGAIALRRAIRALESGASILNFPEGTTSHGDTVLPFKRGIFGAAARTGTPIVPARIELEHPSFAWIGDDPFVPHYLRFAGRARTRVKVTFGDRMEADLAAEVLAERARAVIGERR